MKVLLTTVVGLEGYAIKELKERFSLKGETVRKGRIIVDVPSVRYVALLNYLMRTVERVVLLERVEEIHTLEDIYKIVVDVEWEKYISLNKSFAVRSERIGEHPFTSIDIQTVAGKAVIDRFLESYGKRPPVNLTNPDIIIRADLDQDTLFLGIDTTGKNALHKRGWRVYDHPASLNTTIASAMLMEAGKPAIFVDPMAGGGTIPIEGELAVRNVPHFIHRTFSFERLFEIPLFRIRRKLLSDVVWHEIDILGGDRFVKHVKGCRKNVRSAGCTDVRCTKLDATKDKIYSEIVVTNPPYGLRIADPAEVKKLYVKFVENLYRQGVQNIVLLTPHLNFTVSVLSDRGYEIINKNEVLYGKLRVFLIHAVR